mmetsp:Transcript_1739/g.4399  ORF Transcript_1739/g.4399 Transcript_1739/m.4399 type:complete len:111 (-) Transcript_1739:701-1033(-)
MSEKTFVGFSKAKPEQWLNLLLAHGLFWGLAVPAVIEFGYSDDNESRNEDFGIASGPSGNGVFPLLLTAVLATTIAFIVNIVEYFSASEPTKISPKSTKEAEPIKANTKI